MARLGCDAKLVDLLPNTVCLADSILLLSEAPPFVSYSKTDFSYALVDQLAESTDLKSVKSGFNSQ